MTNSVITQSEKASPNVRVPLLRAHRAFFRAAGWAAPALAARCGEALFRTPPRHRTSQAERAALERARRSAVRVRGGSVAVWRWGMGSPVLLVHGWGSRGARLHSFVEPLLAAGLSPVAFDAPGHGESQGWLSSLPEFVTATEAVAESIGDPFEGIVGHSVGGAAAVLALARGVRARRAVLLAPAANPGGYASAFAALFGIAPEIRQRVVANLERRFGFRWEDFDAVAASARLAIPSLVFHDRDDPDVPWTDGAAIAGAWPGAQLVTTEGLGHRRIVHEPGVVLRAVEFLTITGDQRLEALRS